MGSVKEDSDVLHVAQCAKKIGKTEAALRMAVARESDDIPPWFYMGRRIAWRVATVDKWLADRERKAIEERRKKRAPVPA